MSTARLLGIGMSGMLAQSTGMAVIGNNIANSQTVGFKAGTAMFEDTYFPPSMARVNGVQSQMGTGVKVAGVLRDWTPGSIRETGVMTHLSIMGDGFIPLDYNGESLFTRSGDFAISQTGVNQYVLMRPNGAVLVDSAGDRIVMDAVPISMHINQSGAIILDGATITGGLSQVSLQRFGNPDTMEQVGGGMFREMTNTTRTTAVPETPGQNGCGFLIQGGVELSNVDLVREFTDMISIQRAFQANARTVTTANTMLEEVLNMKR